MLRTATLTLPGSPLRGENPLPPLSPRSFGVPATRGEFPEEIKKDLGSVTRIMPYGLQDRYSRETRPITFRTVTLENSFLCAVVLPECGCRLWSLYDKRLRRELVMSNPVFRPGNLAIRNAWLSGGIEWNFGTLGHHAFTCDDVFCAALKDEAGDDFLRFYEYERSKECVWQVDLHLPEDSPLLYSHVKIFNPNAHDVTTYWWTNIAIPGDGVRVLSSSPDVIVAADGGLSYEKLPFISPFPGKDLSYPENAGRSFDYFYQAPDGAKSAWQCGVYPDGFAFFDRSTAPLLYHKMFCWGNHRAGDRWQEFLSRPGSGRYVEIQSGIARSQMHDRIFPAEGTLEWTQCYGGGLFDPAALRDSAFSDAAAAFSAALDGVLSEDALLGRDSIFARDALISTPEGKLIHSGSGFGALEARRREKSGLPPLPPSVCFPAFTLGKKQYDWLTLLETGSLPDHSPDEPEASFMVSPKWMPLLEAAPDTPYKHRLLGTMYYEQFDRSHISAQADDPEAMRAWSDRAKAEWELDGSAWSLRNLVRWHIAFGSPETAAEYYERVFALPAAMSDFAFAAEYLALLSSLGRWDRAWALYESLPEDIQKADRVTLSAALPALRLKKLDFIGELFGREYADIREGECSLTDIWFEYSARLLAEKRGLPFSDGLVQEAKKLCPPPYAIDFRMSV